MKKHLRQTVVLLVALVALALLLHVWIHRSDRAKALKEYKAALVAKGEKLSFAELTVGWPPGMSPSPFETALVNATTKLGGAKWRPGTLEAMRYVGAGRASVVWRLGATSWTTSGKSSATITNAAWEAFSSQLESFQPSLDAIRTALKDPPAQTGLSRNPMTARTVGFLAFRTTAQWLSASALCEVRRGRLGEALLDLEALAALTRVNREEYLLVAQMIRIAVGRLALTAMWEALQAPGWTPPQLERLQRACEAVGFVDGLERGFEGERAGAVEFFARARKPGGWKFGQIMGPASNQRAAVGEFLTGYVLVPVHQLTGLDQDELFCLQNDDQRLERLRSLKSGRPWADAKKEEDKVQTQLNSSVGSERFDHLFSLFRMPNFSKAIATGMRAETECRMTVIAIALKRFELEHGRQAPDLDALAPELSPVPPDPMTARPFCYRPRSDGGFLLYSAGEDGNDNGGDATPVVAGRFGMWEGRDAVWPEPANP